MRRFIFSCIGLLLMAPLLGACAAPASGPRTWLDRPLDRAKLPLAPVTIQAHASDADGVGSFEFFIDDVLLATVPAGGGLLEEVTAGWTPIEPGTYRISARGIDSRGNSGSGATSVVSVGQLPTPSPSPSPGPEGEEIIFFVEPEVIPPDGCATLHWDVLPSAEALLDDDEVPPTGERQVCPEETTVYQLWVLETGQAQTATLRVEPGAGAPTATVVPITGTPPATTRTPTAPPRAPTGTATAPPRTSTPTTPPPPTIVSFQADPASIVEGGCTTLGWAVDGAFTGVWLDGEGVGDHDSTNKCPGSTTTYSLVARSPGGEDQARVTVTVSEAPTPSPTVPPPDTSPPDISNAEADPDSILTEGPGCQGYSRTTTVSATITDAGGVASVVTRWTLGSDSGEVAMINYGGDYYEAVLGPFGSTGELAILIVASDGTGFTAQTGPLTVHVQQCVG